MEKEKNIYFFEKKIQKDDNIIKKTWKMKMRNSKKIHYKVT